MALTEYKLSTYADNVASLPDAPSDAGMTAEELKAVFDGRTDKEVKEKHNGLIDAMETELAGKVDKESGKGLSSNDYTAAEKAKLAGISAGATKAEASAENGALVIDGVKRTVYTHPESHPASMITGLAEVAVSGSFGDLSDTPGNASTTAAGLVQLSTSTSSTSTTLAATASAVKAAYDLASSKVDKENGKGLSEKDYTAAEKQKLAGISAGATKAEASGSNGNLLVDGVETAVYTHPAGPNPHNVTKADIGLGNVDNTADADKPVSTAVQTELGRIEQSLTEYPTCDEADMRYAHALEGEAWGEGTVSVTDAQLGTKAEISVYGAGRQETTPSPDAPVTPTWAGGELAMGNQSAAIPSLRGLPDGSGGWAARDALTIGADGSVQVLRKIGSVALDGTESWLWQSNTYYKLDNGLELGGTGILCSHYAADSYSRVTAGTGDKTIALYHSASLDRVAILDKAYTTVADFKAYLAAQYAAGTPVTVWYELAEPVVESLGAVAEFTIQDSTTTLSATGQTPSLALSYKRDASIVLAGKADAEEVLSKTNTASYTPSASYHPATKKYVDDSVSAAGGGDMLKAVYDANNNGRVDDADKVNGLTVESAVPANAKFTDTVYTHPESHPASMITGLAEVAVSGSFGDLSDTPGNASTTAAGLVQLSTSTSSTSTTLAATASAVKAAYDLASSKVDKESGKGLSANDYTTEEKQKLAGVESGAQANVQADWDATDSGSDAYIKNKPGSASTTAAGLVQLSTSTSSTSTALAATASAVKAAYDKAVEAASAGSVNFGSYTGNGTASRKITLSKTPNWVLILGSYGTVSTFFYGTNTGAAYGGLAVTGSPAKHYDNGMAAVEITTGGFNVFYDLENKIYTNNSDKIYNYIWG